MRGLWAPRCLFAGVRGGGALTTDGQFVYEDTGSIIDPATVHTVALGSYTLQLKATLRAVMERVITRSAVPSPKAAVPKRYNNSPQFVNIRK